VQEKIRIGLIQGLYPAQIDAMHGFRSGFSSRIADAIGMSHDAKRNYRAYCNRQEKAARDAERVEKNARNMRLREKFGIDYDPAARLRELRDNGLATRRGFKGVSVLSI